MIQSVNNAIHARLIVLQRQSIPDWLLRRLALHPLYHRDQCPGDPGPESGADLDQVRPGHTFAIRRMATMSCPPRTATALKYSPYAAFVPSSSLFNPRAAFVQPCSNPAADDSAVSVGVAPLMLWMALTAPVAVICPINSTVSPWAGATASVAVELRAVAVALFRRLYSHR